jgi:hypothetical protein|nr:MAG TPA: acetyl-coA carboxylase zinc finger domain protein [Bacteriophage sp.]DAN64248.1 MAG TPA: acetyl-coA carboxylase zinc finger domain protein [Bacteriophage sp.]
MKHQKEWRTCDRCGKEIKAGLLCTNSITRNGIFNITYVGIKWMKMETQF